MVNLDVAPFLGAIVLSTSVWNKIPADQQAKLIENSLSLEKELDSQVVDLEAKAVTSMQKYGLIVNNLTPAQRRLWEQDANEGLPRAMGTSFDKETFDRISGQLKDFRAAQKK